MAARTKPTTTHPSRGIFPRNLFHVTDPTKVKSILRRGLRANEEGFIFVFSDERLANSIAIGQLFLPTYGLLSIDGEGIYGDVMPDEVAELAAPWQWIIEQPVITPKFIRFLGNRATEAGPDPGWEAVVFPRVL